MKTVLGVLVGIGLVMASITVIGLAVTHSFLSAIVGAAETERAQDELVPK